MQPKISILIPVYNVSKFLPRCLESCINQTFKDIEIVCINDGSTDNSLEVLNEYAKKDSRIVIVSKENGGLPSARNAGMNNAHGEYVFFLDADDYIDLRSCEILYEKAKKEDATVVIFGAQIIPESKSDAWFEKTLIPQNKKYPILGFDDFLSEPYMFPFLWRDFVLREHIEKNKFRLDEEIVIGEDTGFQFKILPLAKNVVSISNRLYFYDMSRDNSLTNNKKYKDIYNRVKLHLFLVEKLHDDWEARKIYNEDAIPNFLRWVLEFFYWDFCSITTYQKPEIATSIIELMECCKVDDYINKLTNYYQDMYKKIKDWSKKEQVDVSDKKLSLYIPIYGSTGKDDVETLIKQFEKYSDSINLIGLTHYNDANRFMDIESLHETYDYFNLKREDDESSAVSIACSRCPTDYFGVLSVESIMAGDYGDVLNFLGECDLLIASGGTSCAKTELVKANSSNVIFKKSMFSADGILSKDFDCFTVAALKLEALEAAKNVKNIQEIFIGEEKLFNSTDNVRHKIKQLDFIIYLINKANVTKDNSYRIIASEIANNQHFIKNTISLPFGWSDENIHLVKELLRRILIISNSHQIRSVGAVNKLLIEFIRNNHTHMANIIKLIIC